MQLRTKKVLFLLFLFNFLFLTYSAFAQNNNSKKGKPATKKWKAEIRKAKKGNHKSILFVTQLYRGDMLAPDNVKNYSKALKWLSKIKNAKGDKAIQKNREYFLIHATGGFGAKRDKSAAKKNLARYCKKKEEVLSYEDKRDLDLCKIFKIKTNTPENKMLLGRYYLEFGLSYDIGQYWLSSSAKEGDSDAKYLREKWTFLKKTYKKETFSDKSKSLMLKHAELGSQMAQMEYIFATNGTAKMLKKKEAQKYLEPILNSEDAELQFKANLLFLPFLKGKQKLSSLRQITVLHSKIGGKDSELVKKAIVELSNVDTKIQTVADLHAFAKKQKFQNFNFDIRGFQNSFGGKYQNLIDLFSTFSSKENANFIGEQNLANYAIEFQEKLTKTLEKQTKINLLVGNFLALSSANNPILVPAEKLSTYKAIFSRKATKLIRNTREVDLLFNGYAQISSGISQGNLKGFDIKPYDKALSNRVSSILASSDIKLLSYLKRAFEFNPDTHHILPNYQSLISQRLQELNAGAEDIYYYELEYGIRNQYFNTFSDAKRIYDLLDANRTISYAKRMALMNMLRQKAVNDIYGENPSVEFIVKMKDKFTAQKWLKGTGNELIRDKLFNYQKTKIEETTFRSLAEGQKFYKSIQNDDTYDYSQKKQLIAKLSRTVIENVYNKRPFGQELLGAKKTIFATSWISSEGKQLFSAYLFEYFEQQVTSVQFTTLAEAKKLYDNVNSGSDLTFSQKKQLLPTIRRKALNDVYGTSPSSENIIKIGRLLNKNAWLSPEGTQIYSAYASQAFIDKIQNTHFRTLGQARNFNNEIKSNRTFSWHDRSKLSAVLKRKSIEDVYGEHPRPKQIQQFHKDLKFNSWLEPEGTEIYFEFLNDSKYSFSGTLFSLNRSKTYHYKVEIKKDSHDEYKIEVIEIKSGRTSLAYSSAASINLEGDTYVIKIFIANLKGGFRWVLARNDYLKVSYQKNNPYIETEAFNQMKKHASHGSHGFKQQELKEKDEPHTFSEKAAIRDAMKYFIFSYNFLMK